MTSDDRKTDAQNFETSFVLRFFEEFYSEVVKLKKRVQNEIWISDDPDKEATPESTAKYILVHLKSILDRQMLAAPRYGGEFAASYYEEAQKIMAGLADEVFLYLDWKAHNYWENNILESKVFGTHTAGETFFKRLDKFLVMRDPIRADVARIYLLALGLGFKGKYRDQDDMGKLDSYKKQLYSFIYHQDSKLFKGIDKLFPDSYVHTLETGMSRKLYDFRPWVALFFITFLVLLYTSYNVWYRTTGEMQQTVKNIFDEKTQSTGRLT